MIPLCCWSGWPDSSLRTRPKPSRRARRTSISCSTRGGSLRAHGGVRCDDYRDDYRDKLRMTSNALPRTGTASKLGGDPSAKG